MKEINLETIEGADYSTLVGIIRERNRPSGGIRTLAEFAVRAHLSPTKKVLEVGSNTGFSVVNLAALSGAFCVGIDINPKSVEESKVYAYASGVTKQTDFQVGSALEIPYPDQHFDALWVSNVTSFISNKDEALKEYFRVLRPNGFIGFAPIYYRATPPKDLLLEVENLVGTKINITDLTGWKKQIETSSLKRSAHLVECFSQDYLYIDQAGRIDEWVELVLDKPHLKNLPQEALIALSARYRHCMATFNSNLRFCGYSLIVYQKRTIPDEPELFYTKASKDD